MRLKDTQGKPFAMSEQLDKKRRGQHCQPMASAHPSRAPQPPAVRGAQKQAGHCHVHRKIAPGSQKNQSNIKAQTPHYAEFAMMPTSLPEAQ
ncbi:MAG: hypothetical protein LBD01_02335 [Puniceicoccales bacterium]|jgi:hypothetical protein|nr:hypothetical protein [Puniceicoccales bacterium]